MNPIVLSIIVFIIAESIVDIVRICANTISQRRNLKQENELLRTNIISLNKKIYEQQAELYVYKTYRNRTRKNFYDSDVKEAVKYAMKKAHPDNGGSAEDFNKFRELYNKLK